MGISVEIPVEIQLYIWKLIDNRLRSSAKLDYLQIFKLSVKKNSLGNYMQVIEQTQEQPPYTSVHEVLFEKSLNTKIFVHDSGECTLMLLPDEY
jgi:hypothetical protein